jgi:hypothetical protein
LSGASRWAAESNGSGHSRPARHHEPQPTHRAFASRRTTIGAVFGYMDGVTQTESALFKNNAALKKTEASNQ